MRSDDKGEKFTFYQASLCISLSCPSRGAARSAENRLAWTLSVLVSTCLLCYGSKNRLNREKEKEADRADSQDRLGITTLDKCQPLIDCPSFPSPLSGEAFFHAPNAQPE